MSSEIENKLIINTSFILDNEVEVTVRNIDINAFDELNKEEIIRIILETKWYMYGNYDVINIFNNDYVILNKTKKKVELARYNIKK